MHIFYHRNSLKFIYLQCVLNETNLLTPDRLSLYYRGLDSDSLWLRARNLEFWIFHQIARRVFSVYIKIRSLSKSFSHLLGSLCGGAAVFEPLFSRTSVNLTVWLQREETNAASQARSPPASDRLSARGSGNPFLSQTSSPTRGLLTPSAGASSFLSAAAQYLRHKGDIRPLFSTDAHTAASSAA